MKVTTVIDPQKEEEVVIYAHKRTALVEEIETLVAQSNHPLLGYGEGEILPLSFSSVECFFVADGKLYARTGEKTLRIAMRLYQLEELLDNSFVKINQSAIVNIKSIRRFEASVGGSLRVVMQCGWCDYISRRQLKFVKERMGLRL